MPSLNETATTTAIVNGKAATWRLAQPDSPEPAESAELPRDGSTFYSESIIGTDGRTPVNEADIRDGGKYRSIVKILSCFNDGGESVWMMGTGWLIRPDLLVTAGHVVYDWGHGYRAATQIKCYIGYKGRESVETDICQARYGQTIVTTAEWIQTTESRPRDVAFIKVTKPFTGNLRLFNYVDTPSKDSATLGVVGYPGDMSYNNEKGGEMYEQFKMTEYNLNTSDRHMIRYKLSTFGGKFSIMEGRDEE
ncbi:hypothetical protein QQS21_004753 [Conoideocrella luteorostrata]|uniref:Peptidase S1 domain-containing protein n=1 Tax=Conoideocrella luteorostrata TaxID=1105319 RepID=A0AAJ0FUD7_9HYPO|nr:hypothetical protein QQS21_004753 [Conoideocrella luteorostrata]